MSNNEHPFTPPPELVEEWASDVRNAQHFATQAAQWGADQELEACCEFMQHEDFHGFARELRAARRPKPPSLKAGAIEVLDELDGLFELPAGHYNTILRALEKLDDSL